VVATERYLSAEYDSPNAGRLRGCTGPRLLALYFMKDGNMAISFEGQVAVVTGAGAGLGRAYAIDLAKRGAKVVVNDLGGDPHGQGENRAPAQKVVDEIKELGGEAVPNYDDVSSYEGGFNIVKTAIDNFGRLDIVICNAGILRDVAFHNMSEDDWDKVFAVHIKGSFTVLRAAWPVFRQQSYGRV